MKYRIQIIKPWVDPFHVPMYITRVDIDKGNVGTHGWQVRYYLAPLKFFSDTLRLKGKTILRTPYFSLDDAIAYLKKYYKGPKPRIKYPEPKLIWCLKKNRNVKEAYVIFPNPIHGKASLKIYVGTENTITEERIQKAKKKLLMRSKEFYKEYFNVIKNKFK